MEVGIGLPATIPGVTGDQLTEWARRSESAGFSSLGTIDRIAYPNYEPFIALSAAAAVTERIRLLTSIAILPYRGNAAFVAKQAATIQSLSGGRLVLGVAVGGREDDYELAEEDFDGRGRRFEHMLGRMTEIWEGHEAGPEVEPPPLVIGGSVSATFERVARYGDGWIQGGNTPDNLAAAKEKTEAAWKDAGRQGSPRIMGLFYYSLGDDAEQAAESYLGDYYAWLGDETAGMIVSSAATDADSVKQYLAAFEQAGADEMICFPCSTDSNQVDLLAEVAL